ncbi:MAG TPA: molybdopterin cofactor-binding domain-containing protein [Steroidobacteraceae bacterium]|nr:molybdopterin cofactor-binding domain-containing protein [Steroidobacteraceae bacterium]
MLRVNRREALLAVAGAGAALVVSGLLSPPARGRVPGVRGGQLFPVTAWIRVSQGNSVTLVASQSEMGQGTTTTLAAILADELYLPFARVAVEFAPFDPAYRDPVYQWMFTGNSQSISSFYDIMRKMGAAAREMLVRAAAERFGRPADEMTCDGGLIHHARTGRSVTFGEVAAAAGRLPVPTNPKPRRDSSLDGRSMARWDIPAKVDGSAGFGIDVKVPGMLVAALRRAPRFGASLTSYDADTLRTKPGVVSVVALPDGIAVVARTYWQARRAIDSATLTWSSEGSSFSSGAELAPIYAERLAQGPFFTNLQKGAAAEEVAQTHRHSATYQIPFQAHATMEPMNCTAHVADGRCEIWVPTQGTELVHTVAAQLTGLPMDKIVVHRTFIGGGFGRRLLGDFVKQTLVIAMALKQPVKLIWSREEDFGHDFYRPGMLHAISGSLSANGALIALSHRVVSPSHMLYIFPRAMFPKMTDWTEPAAPPPKMDTMAVEGLLEAPYDIPNLTVEQHRLEVSVPVSVWRTTGHGPNNFVLESFVDELAFAAKADPLAFRRSLLAKNPRALRVLNLVADKAGWGAPAGANVYRGIALAQAFGGIIAQVVELSLRGGEIKLHRVVAAVDCGRTLDPGIAESNILGGIVWGISGMKTAVTFENGRAVQSNFDSFQPAHLWETPHCEVHFIDSGEPLGGTGELGPVPLHAAIGNAIFAATGNRIRKLPLSLSGLSFA